MTTQMPKRSAVPRIMLSAIVAVGLAALVLTTSCQSTIENRNPVGELFPQVTGESLEGVSTPLPLDEPAVFLLGYVQDAQFDADRWLVGLLQAAPAVRILEVPTVRGIFPQMISNTIDSGMRSGIPEEDWQTVVTVYGSDAKRIIESTGNEKPRNIRVMLLNGEGRVLWFHDRGFSAGKLLELQAASEALVAK